MCFACKIDYLESSFSATLVCIFIYMQNRKKIDSLKLLYMLFVYTYTYIFYCLKVLGC